MIEFVSFDPARLVNIKFRINRQADNSFIFTTDGDELDITGFTWEFFISRHPGDKRKQISLTLGSGLSIPIYQGNVIEAHFSADQTNIPEGEYYFELVRTDIQKTWLNGLAFFSFGPVDNENSEINLDVNEESQPIQIEINSSTSAADHWKDGWTWDVVGTLPDWNKGDYGYGIGERLQIGDAGYLPDGIFMLKIGTGSTFSDFLFR